MNRLSRTFAAVAATTMLLSVTVPALAAEDTTVATDVSAKASPIKHRRMTSIRPVRHVASVTPLQRNLGCSGEWCGRQFVLMIGIGF
jgi:hypothetical protein